MRPLKLGFVTEMIVLELEPNKGFAGVFIKTFYVCGLGNRIHINPSDDKLWKANGCRC